MSTRGRAGFTLLEMLVVIFAMSIAFGFGGTILLAALRIDQAGAATLRLMAWRTELADQFRSDVARADAAPQRLGELTAGPTCLILHRPDGGHIVYQWHDDGRLERIARAADGETRRVLPVGASNVTVEFGRGDGARPLMTLRLVETPPSGSARRVEVSALLGGDLR
ncbi:MAG TPA: prepilin-type N-terminal cleavage/methylation domain-containing protein [Gemmataceae bacterium]|jgi:prepilin-type N-terminal cleavage/methylation domain-containing protein|nr:prepilin-type N-terminal cleavage/methylation domain-containing protein [Gemmataceae bacterium]